MPSTLLIALDGATFDVLDPLMADGTMPFLRDFCGRGVRAGLMSTPHPLTPPAFVSMVTGRSPGQHGLFDFVKGEDRDGQVYFTLYDSRDVRCETIWSIANRQSRSVTHMNFVMSTPVQQLCGVVVPGMTHWRHLRRHLHPPALMDRLKAQDWFDPKTLCWDFDHMEKAIAANPSIGQKEWVQDHIARERQWFQVMKFAMKKEPTDLAAIVFDGVDKLQHVCWEYLDPKLQGDDPEIGNLCRQYFQELDGFIRDLVALAGPRARTFIVSDHGFGPVRTTFHLNRFLHKLGLLHWLPGADGDGAFDWARTKAYCPSQSSNGIFLRVPEAERAKTLKMICEELRKFHDPASGVPLVKDILVREQAFAGPWMRLAPDLTVVQCDHGFVSTAPGDAVAEKKPKTKGTHYPEGIFIAAGEGIRADGAKLDRRSILDVAPTVLYSVNLPIPENFEGRLVEEAFDAARLAEDPVEKGGPAGQELPEATAAAGGAPVRTAEEEAAVYDQLRALGYIE
jgi:predicted AlkP superfamily phosphohydrolase/phosphomutase